MDRKQTNAAEVARRAGLNPTGVYDIMSGKSRAPRLDTLGKIADALNVPISALFTDPEEAQLDQELLEALGMMTAEDRQRFLMMARALATDTPKT
jgi:transcriptional regulator with XRE-family HTH domain